MYQVCTCTYYYVPQFEHGALHFRIAVNCLCSVLSCTTCWCPDSELADGHHRECQYCRTAEVMQLLDAVSDQLLEDDELVGRVKDVKDVERRLRHRLLPHNAWQLIPFFKLFMSAPKDKLHQWYVHACTSLYLVYTCMHQVHTGTLLYAYSIHFHNIYIDGKENTKMTGD